VGYHKCVRVGLVGGDVDRRGVEVVEVDSAYDVFGDASGEGDGDPVALTMCGIPGALAAEMSGVSGVAPRLLLELSPLAKE
jgi:hypothetical protein